MEKLHLDERGDIGSAWANEKINEMVKWINNYENREGDWIKIEKAKERGQAKKLCKKWARAKEKEK